MINIDDFLVTPKQSIKEITDEEVFILHFGNRRYKDRPPIPLKTRMEVYKRAGYKRNPYRPPICEDCMQETGQIEHHITYQCVFGEEEPDDISLLCVECHRAVHTDFDESFCADIDDLTERRESFHHAMEKDD
jgi:hypothetical protein